ncbi:MAG: hypothetical protein KTR32_40250 [Granulosicoccus sp.]|nr:hypothetical protein [Granulosicoccus sp.]
MSSNSVFAEEPAPDSIEAQAASASEKEKLFFFDFLESIENFDLSVGDAEYRLKNPEGFDVATVVHDEGRPPDKILFGYTRMTITAYSSQSTNRWLRKRYALSLNGVDYEGLDIRTLSGDVGLVAEAGNNLARINIGASLGTGLTRSESYNDSAFHPLIQASIHSRLSLYRFFIEISTAEQYNFARKLDRRNAEPRLWITSLMLGFRFM